MKGARKETIEREVRQGSGREEEKEEKSGTRIHRDGARSQEPLMGVLPLPSPELDSLDPPPPGPTGH